MTALAASVIGSFVKDVINGKDGDDRLTGGIGDATHVVTGSGDKVIDAAGEGFDRVLSAVAATLAANVEEPDLFGAGKLTGTGNAGNNVIYGGGGGNLLKGLGGDDYIQGGSAEDMITGGGGCDVGPGWRRSVPVHQHRRFRPGRDPRHDR